MDIVGTALPHSEFGAPQCCGCLNGIVRGDEADIVCNECGNVVRRVPVGDLQRVLDEMTLTLDAAMARCPHCGALHIARRFSEPIVFVCGNCRQSVTVKRETCDD